MEPEVLLDTDTLSAILRPDPMVVARAREYITSYIQLNISTMTRFEVLRGFEVRDAKSRLRSFENFCKIHNVLDLTDDIVVRASGIYADLYRRGVLIGDADILIAATALVHGMAIATNNERHFSRINGLQLENWLK